MFNYLIRRLLLMIPTFFGITLVFFLILQMVPGGPVEQELLRMRSAAMESGTGGGSLMRDVQISPDVIAQMKKFYGFDKPILVRYFLWLGLWPRQINEKIVRVDAPFRLPVRYVRQINGIHELQKWIKVAPGERGALAVFESGVGADFAFDQYPELPDYNLIKTWYPSEGWHIKKSSGDSMSIYQQEFSGVLSGSFGQSYTYREPVMRLILKRMHISLYFGIIGFILTYLVSIPLGILKAVKHTSALDTGTSVLIFIGYSIPGYLIGALILVYFGGGSFWDLIPLGGFRSDNFNSMPFWAQVWDQIHHTIVPVIAYSIGSFATLCVMMKNSLMENLGQDYVRTAFAKGLSEKRVILVHALKNSLIPIATGIGGLIGIIFTGSYFIEKTFNIDGIGLLGYKALINRDYPITLGFLVLGTIVQLFGNLISDITLAIVDPRIRFK
ncbi:MAG: ABC transporter permease subunit [Chitinivibrionales bacterium]|nr:ABC transporter permease subunit [Chitinivibrionales bacterium]